MSAQDVMIGTLAGLAAGIAIGLLLAPAPGSETRQALAGAADAVRKRFRHLKGASPQEVQELIGMLEREVQGLQDDVRRRVLHIIKTASHDGHPAAEPAL